MEQKLYWWDELAGELVEVTDPAQLDGDEWEATGKEIGAAEEWRTDRHEGWLIRAYSRDEAEATLRRCLAGWE